MSAASSRTAALLVLLTLGSAVPRVAAQQATSSHTPGKLCGDASHREECHRKQVLCTAALTRYNAEHPEFPLTVDAGSMLELVKVGYLESEQDWIHAGLADEFAFAAYPSQDHPALGRCGIQCVYHGTSAESLECAKSLFFQKATPASPR